MDNFSFTYEDYFRCINQILEISNSIMDGWKLETIEGRETGTYITKKITTCPQSDSQSKDLLTVEYHIAFHISYGVPVLCFNVWKQDGSLLTLEDYWKTNQKLHDSSMYETLTQMDHPVLCRPFLTLHPCKTQEIMQPFLEKSKNPLVSWLSAVGPFVNLSLAEDYILQCCHS